MTNDKYEISPSEVSSGSNAQGSPIVDPHIVPRLAEAIESTVIQSASPTRDLEQLEKRLALQRTNRAQGLIQERARIRSEKAILYAQTVLELTVSSMHDDSRGSQSILVHSAKYKLVENELATDLDQAEQVIESLVDVGQLAIYH